MEAAARWFIRDNGNIAPGQMYQISVWVKCSTANSAGVALWIHDTQGAGSVSTNVTATNSWQQISVAFTGTMTQKIRVHLVQFAGNTLTTYWDGVTVTPLPPNGDFEAGSLGPWSIAGGNGWVGTIAHTGRFGATLGGTTAQSWIYQDVAGLIPGQMYVVSAWVQSSIAQNNGVLVFLHDTQGNGAVYNSVPATTAWQLVSTAYTATSTGKLRIHLVQNPGTAELTYWDDVTVVPSSGSGTSSMAMAQGIVAPASPMSGSNTRRAAGSSATSAIPASQLPPYPPGT